MILATGGRPRLVTHACGHQGMVRIDPNADPAQLDAALADKRALPCGPCARTNLDHWLARLGEPSGATISQTREG